RHRDPGGLAGGAFPPPAGAGFGARARAGSPPRSVRPPHPRHGAGPGRLRRAPAKCRLCAGGCRRRHGAAGAGKAGARCQPCGESRGPMGAEPTSLLNPPQPVHTAAPSAAVSRAVVGALLLQVAIGGGTFLVAKAVVGLLPIPTAVMWRYLISTAIFLCILAVLPGPMWPPRYALRTVTFLGLLAGPLNQGLFFWGIAHSTPAHGALLYALTPLGVYLYALARGRERA